MREDWKELRIKDFCSFINRGTTPIYIDSSEYCVINQATFSKGYFDLENIRYSENNNPYALVKTNDLLMASTGGGVLGKVYYFQSLDENKYYADTHVTILRSEKGNTKYLYYIFSTKYEYINSILAKGSTNQTELQRDKLLNYTFYTPPLPVQHAIANYLDKKLGVIDKHISLLENKRDTYKRLRKNLINHVVRQGLVEPVETKDSEIEWLGKIPKHWEVKRVKDLFNISRGRVIPQTELDESGYPVYSSQTENDGCLGFIKTYDYNTEALTWTTDGVNAGSVFYRTGKFNCTNICGVLSPKSRFILKFIYYFLSVNTIHYKRLDTNGAKIMSNEMAPIILVLPPLSEQQTIADYLDKQTQKIDNILENISEQLGKLAQLKKSLINETVTGNRNITTGDTNIA